MKKCPYCGKEILDDSKYCSNCGHEISNFDNDDTIIDVVEEEHDYQNDFLVREQQILRDEYARRASNAFGLSIISIFLCCCLLTTVASFVLSLLLIFDMKKLSEETKNTIEYRSVRNKNIMALVISSLLLLLTILNYIYQVQNPIDYNEMLNEMQGDVNFG